MQGRKHFGHWLATAGLFSWMALAIAVSTAPLLAQAISSNDVLQLSNQTRTEHNLHQLSSNAQLNTAAQQKAEHMRDQGYFAHTAPDGTTGWSFITANGYIYSTAGENLAASNQGAQAVISGWLDSPGHKANLLSKSYSEVGYGIAFVGTWEHEGKTYPDTYFVVAIYAKPDAPVASAGVVRAAADELNNLPTSSQSSLPIAEQLAAQTGISKPLTAVSTSVGRLIAPEVALALASIALLAIVAGVVLEIRWVRAHHRIQHIHFPHI